MKTIQPTALQVTTTTNIPLERVADLLCNAFEGGSNYWAVIKKKKEPKAFDLHFRYMADLFERPCSYTDYPLNIGGYLVVGDIEGDMKDEVLDLGTIQHGLNIMASQYPRHWNDFINNNDDADTGDVFLQCCLYGEVVFG